MALVSSKILGKNVKNAHAFSHTKSYSPSSTFLNFYIERHFVIGSLPIAA